MRVFRGITSEYQTIRQMEIFHDRPPFLTSPISQKLYSQRENKFMRNPYGVPRDSFLVFTLGFRTSSDFSKKILDICPTK